MAKAEFIAADAAATAQRMADEQALLNRHRQSSHRIDASERRTLSALEAKRRGPGGRAVEFIRGRYFFDVQRDDIVERHESERMTLRREFEAQRRQIMDRHEAGCMKLRRDFETMMERQGKPAQPVGNENGR